MLNYFINKLAMSPGAFILLRKILEANFKGEKAVIKEYFAVNSDDKILDIGSGTGEFSVFFKPENYTGIDIEPAYIDYAKKHYQGTFLLGDAARLPFSNYCFDKAVILGVLHHLDDSLCYKIFTEMKRVLKPGASILVMEDTRSDGDSVITKILHSLDKGNQIRTADEYNAILKPHFKITESFKIKSGLCPYQVFLLKNIYG